MARYAPRLNVSISVILVLRQLERSINDSRQENAFIETALLQQTFRNDTRIRASVQNSGDYRPPTGVELAHARNGWNTDSNIPESTHTLVQMAQTAIRPKGV